VFQGSGEPTQPHFYFYFYFYKHQRVNASYSSLLLLLHQSSNMTRTPITTADVDWILGNPANTQRCTNLYGHLEKDDPSTTTVVCTMALIVLAVLIEVMVNISYTGTAGCGSKDEEEAIKLLSDPSVEASAIPNTTPISEQPRREDGLQAEPHVASGDGAQATPTTSGSKSTSTKRSICCTASPSPHTRATRLAFAMILYAGVLAAFILRIQEAMQRPYVDILCTRFIHPSTPNWTAITFLNIIPFVCASVAFLRAIVDCLLVRSGTSLTYDFDSKEGCCWLPCIPFMSVLIVGYISFECVKVPIALLMGDREVSLWTSKIKKKQTAVVDEIEMSGEEAQGLIGGADIDEEPDTDGLPTYNEVVGPNNSGSTKEGKGGDTV
jgi:hypothetical protein